tara:strand:+ start:475 stop:645 length:171 start_codon:yes stop_codon:yes gene_type:complete
MKNNEINHSAESTTENLPFFSDGYNKWVEKQEDDYGDVREAQIELKHWEELASCFN